MNCPCCNTELSENCPSSKRYTSGKNEQIVYLECKNKSCSFYVCVNFDSRNKLTLTDAVDVLESSVEDIRKKILTKS